MASGEGKKPNANAKGGGKKKEMKKETGLGLSYKKEENFGEWYSEILTADMKEYISSQEGLECHRGSKGQNH